MVCQVCDAEIWDDYCYFPPDDDQLCVCRHCMAKELIKLRDPVYIMVDELIDSYYHRTPTQEEDDEGI